MTNDPNWRLPEVPLFTLSSPDFTEGDTLPQWARSGISNAGGEDRSPTLHWDGAPSGTKSFALTVYDPDAPTGSGYWHWAVYNIPPNVSSLPQDSGRPDANLLPSGAITLPNEERLERFIGAAPPAGHGEHRYVFTLSALDVERLEVPEGSTPAILGFKMFGHTVARAQLTGVSETSV
ncbi:YbhB/YbcL family Raf kinase inhibitor-like protein [Salinibacterium sp. G-O1]|uniref:YbhB/YbcL family Raf kinase inhibitor-like protein n=1 Tax=Salinibacterium sp. G-O1 TaxID=3046208 RepID=UPI0024BAC40C|nr:YbhB/YbcL family Raf kinase inhibitor-like protein [Salinibacterium sp. G-O1]MDJ0334786.1 YbhB/YbcL family Raf kinase inhibitor-like protein [Salinibacterium sp. G-O1]